MEHPSPPPHGPVVGLHLADDAARLVRLTPAGAGAALTGWLTVPLPAGAVHDGLPLAAGRLPDAAATDLVRWVGHDPVRVALATPDAVVVPLAATDPVQAAAARLGAGCAAGGDAVWADVVHVRQRPTALAAARRSSVVRTREALGRAGATPEAIEAAPVALVTLIAATLGLPDVTWTIELHGPRTGWRVTVGRGGRLEGGAHQPGPGSGPGLHLRTAGAGPAAGHPAGDPAGDLAGRVRHALGPGARSLTDADVAWYACALGAALGGLPGAARAVESPDLGAAVVVRPLAPPTESLPRWAVEALPDLVGAPVRPGRARRSPR